MSLRRLRKFARLMGNPVHRGGLLQGVGATIEHQAALGSLRFDSVVDVGANKGQFLLFCAAQWPDARIDCFEPLVREAAKLRAVARAIGPRAHVHNYALGACPGSVPLHVGSRRDSSSLLPLAAGLTEMFAVREVAEVTVEVRRLQDLDLPLGPAALLKVDVQGFEYEVIQGAGERLSAFSHVYVEVSRVEFYAKQKRAEDLFSLLDARGFSLVGEYNAIRRAGGEPLQSDALFVRRAAA